MDYKKVIEDFNSGKIDREKWMVVLDNDGGYWQCLDEAISDDKQRSEQESMEKEYGSPGGYDDIVDVLEAAGVRAEWC